ncbi:hypothetical protein BEWA_001210 [Theileria equi strain WA]|uniref:Major facilitator superfamily (MFS) profile domain-containing protein n=1 Tax=Theileria equi strain WA TaxID=1537102 RepID=L0B0P5_THEEQ|nr:hypothetical protein BEWA_001210 [Theileria equi strain WA]AFZ80714.1 hypothetical protein BEWA_001210 [Theileria equi strain WA]|eukprot:XP_004830380.1 hypothetical protein BEWA_001210 [Theileria equi strain WA]
MEDSGSAVSKSPKRGLEVFHKQKFVFSLINLAVFVENFNLQFLFSSMRGLEVSLGFSPEMLSRFTMVEELSAVAFIPVWGLLCDLFEMKYILMLAIFLSGLLSMVLSTISNFGLMLAVRVINGATIGSVTPSTQIYVVRMMNVGLGIAFGILYSVASVARLVCSLIVTKLSPKTVCYHTSRIISVNLSRLKHQNSFSFLCYFTDGPFISLSFLTLYFQHTGLSDFKAGLFTGLVIIGSAIGGALGGVATEYCHRKSPNYGRILFGIICTVLRLFAISMVLFLVLDDYGKSAEPLLTTFLFITGTTLFTIYYVDRGGYNARSRCIAGIGSGLTFSTLMGAIPERIYGYRPIRINLADAPVEHVRRNAIALRNALFIVNVGTLLVSLFLYVLICFSFGSDAAYIRERVKLESTEINTVKKSDERNECRV